MRRSFFRRWGVGILAGGVFAIVVFGGIAGMPMWGIHIFLAVFAVVIALLYLSDREGGFTRWWQRLTWILGPRTHIVGVVSPVGPQAYSHNDGPWRLGFSFSAWRPPGEVVRYTYRGFDMRVSTFTTDIHKRKLAPYSVVEVQIIGDPEARNANVWRISRTHVPDTELEAFAAELKKPVDIVSSLLGTLHLDRKEGCFRANISWCSRTIELELECDDLDQPECLIGLAEALFRDQQNLQQQVSDFIVAELQASAREWEWNQGQDVSAEALLSRCQLMVISLQETKEVDFIYDDGGIFGGHQIIVRGRYESGLHDLEVIS